MLDAISVYPHTLDAISVIGMWDHLWQPLPETGLAGSFWIFWMQNYEVALMRDLIGWNIQVP